MRFTVRTPARAAFLLALMLRVGWVTWYTNQQGASLRWPDEAVHWQIAHNLVYHGQLATDDGRLAQRMPLYPLFLAPFAAVGELGIPLARVAQAILASIMAFLGARLAQRAVSVWAGWLVGLLIACDPFSIYFSGMLLSETPFSLIAIGLITCAWHTSVRLRISAFLAGEGHRLPASRGSLIVALLTAPLAAAAILTRQSAVAWTPLVLILMWLADPDRRRGFGWLCVQASVVALLILPWGVRNKLALGDFAWLSTNGGVTLYDAQGPQADGSSNQDFLRNMPHLRELSEVQQDRELARAAREQMLRNPGRVLELAWVKFRRTWNPLPNVAEFSGGAAAWCGAAFTVAVVLLAAAGLCVAISRDEPQRRAADIGQPARRTMRRRAVRRRAGLRVLLSQLWLPVIAFTLLHCVYIGSVRYRVPLMPMLEISAAAALAGRVGRRLESSVLRA